MNTLRNKFSWITYAYAAWGISIVGLLGSLIYSDILREPICVLCWYQRIAMYPLVILYAVGIMLKDKKCAYYALPLILIGFLIAIYQVLLQAGYVSNLISCGFGDPVSCTQITFKLFGVFTIPQQALMGFTGILLFNGLVLVGRD
jgi:disulfide bond formation protein DsbB